MSIHEISSALTTAFMAAVNRSEDQADTSKTKINKVALLSFKTGLCALSTPDEPRAGYGRITKEDLADLQNSTDEQQQNILVRIANTMASTPFGMICEIPLKQSQALFVQKYWTTGMGMDLIKPAQVLDVWTDLDDPEVYKKCSKNNKTRLFFYIQNRENSAASKALNDYVLEAIDSLQLLTGWIKDNRKKMTETSPFKLSVISDNDILMKLYLHNIDDEFEYKDHTDDAPKRNIDLRKSPELPSSIEIEVPPELFEEISQRVEEAEFMTLAEELTHTWPSAFWLADTIDGIRQIVQNQKITEEKLIELLETSFKLE